MPLGEREKIYMFRDDYPTKDGTCIREYIHVMDLVSAHFGAIEYIRKDNLSGIFNLGNGNGYSVKEVFDMARRVTNHPISVEVKERRAGGLAALIGKIFWVETTV